jgi:hypothetical protein
MLRKNPLQPPRPFSPGDQASEVGTAAEAAVAGLGFVTPEDFDATGILRGVDPSEPRYWWMPDVYGPADSPVSAGEEVQATSLSAARTVAAARSTSAASAA